MNKTYRLNWLEILRRFIATITLFGAGSIFVWFLTRIQLGLNWETLLCVMMALVGIGAGGWMIQSVLVALWQNPRIQLTENGVMLTTRSTELDWQWDEFTHWSGRMVYHKLYDLVTIYIESACTFFSSNKPPLKIDGLFQDARILADTLVMHIIETQTLGQIEAFQQGKTLEFGTITLNKEGLRQGDTFIPFDDIVSINLKEFYVWVYRKSAAKPTSLVIGDISHVPELLLSVINTLIPTA